MTSKQLHQCVTIQCKSKSIARFSSTAFTQPFLADGFGSHISQLGCDHFYFHIRFEFDREFLITCNDKC